MFALRLKMKVVISVLMLVSLVLSACAPAATPVPTPLPTNKPAAPAATSAPAPTAVPTAVPTAAPTAVPDYLASILKRGTLIVSTDPAYPPQSELVENVVRPTDTKCAATEHTANEFKGFDIAVAVEIAKRLGVEACFVTPDWTLITAGSWAGRWDISVGSMTITPERAKVLYFGQPYYTTPAALFVFKDNTTYTKPSDLDGKKIGVCGGCTYESYLNGNLDIPGETINYVIKDAVVKSYDTDTTALEDLALGDGVRLDAVLTALPT